MVTTRSQTTTNPFMKGDLVRILRDSNNIERVGKVGQVVAVYGFQTVTVQVGHDTPFDKRACTIEKIINHDGLVYVLDEELFWINTGNEHYH
jgi:hypothetical protein